MSSFLHFLCRELALSAPPLPNVRVVPSKLSESYAFLLVPWKLESLLYWGFLICLDCFLFYFTLLPLRLCITFVRLCINARQPRKVITAEVCACTHPGDPITSWATPTHQTRSLKAAPHRPSNVTKKS